MSIVECFAWAFVIVMVGAGLLSGLINYLTNEEES